MKKIILYEFEFNWIKWRQINKMMYDATIRKEALSIQEYHKIFGWYQCTIELLQEMHHLKNKNLFFNLWHFVYDKWNKLKTLRQ